MWNFPDQGANPCPLNWKHGVLATAPPSLTLIFSIQLYFEITGESYAVVRKNTAIPFTQLPQISYNITNKIWKMTQSRYSTVPSLLWADPLPPTLPLQFLPPATTNLFPVSIMTQLQGCCMNRIIQLCHLWGLAFFTQHNSLETHPTQFIYQ